MAAVAGMLLKGRKSKTEITTGVAPGHFHSLRKREKGPMHEWFLQRFVFMLYPPQR